MRSSCGLGPRSIHAEGVGARYGGFILMTMMMIVLRGLECEGLHTLWSCGLAWWFMQTVLWCVCVVV